MSSDDSGKSAPQTNIILHEFGISAAKSAIGAIPYIGALLNEVIFDHRGRIKQERCNRFIYELTQYMASINERDIDIEFLKSEDFSDLFESIMRRVIPNRSEEKMHRFKKILVKQMIAPSYSDYTETFLDLVQRLNEKQIEILGAYKAVQCIDLSKANDYENKHTDKSKMASHRKNNYYNIDEETYKFYVHDLVSKALLIDDGMNRLGTRPMEILEITSFGLAFLRFIEEA